MYSCYLLETEVPEILSYHCIAKILCGLKYTSQNKYRFYCSYFKLNYMFLFFLSLNYITILT